MKVFVKSIVPFFGQNKYTNIRRFSTSSRHKITIFSLEKVQQSKVLSKMATQHILTKAKSRTLSMFTKTTQT